MTKSFRAVIVSALVMGALMAAPAASQGAFHLIKVSEVNYASDFQDRFVELQMYSSGQALVGGHHLRIYDAAGAVQGDYELPNDVANGGTQRTITIGNSPTRDFNYGGVTVDGAGGAVCWNELELAGGGIDCVSWGSFTPGIEPLSSPAGSNAPAIPLGQSLQRRLNRGCATLLEAGDDTNNSAADFVVGAPTPRNNATAPTEKPCQPKAGGKKKKKCKKKKGKKGGASAAKKKKCKKKKKK
jgi:uncharacterized protein